MVLAASRDVADRIGAKDPATWLTGREVIDGPAARRELALARALDERPVVRAGLAEGRFGVDHARIIVTTLADLRDDFPAEAMAGPMRAWRR